LISVQRCLLLLKLRTFLNDVLLPSLKQVTLDIVKEGTHGDLMSDALIIFITFRQVVVEQTVLLHYDVAETLERSRKALNPHALGCQLLDTECDE
jgi:hypothetical protein